MATDILPVRGAYGGPNWLRKPPGIVTSIGRMLIRNPGVLETRYGYAAVGSGTWATNADASALYVWNDGGTTAYIVLKSTTLSYSTDGTTFNDYSGSFAAASVHMRFAEAKQNLYLTSAAGVYRLDAYNGTPTVAGTQKPLAITTTSAGAGTAVVDGSARAYRACLKFTDANGNVFRSAPSGRCVIRNSGGSTINVTVVTTLPTGLSTSYVLELYASAGTTSATDEPSDEMGLVYETFLDSGEVSGRSISITDVVPDAMRGATGYFCPSQEGIAQSNERPPLANDVAWFKDSMLYAGTTGKHRLILRLMNTSAGASSTALEADDTITVAGVTYTAKASPANESQFALVTGSTQQVNVRETTLSLVAKINAHSSNSTVYAYYLSGPDDPAGIFMVEERGLGGNSFAAVSSVAACWTPELPSAGTTISSAAEVTPNRIYFSKPGQSEAVPLLNYIDVGSVSDGIARIVSLRDAVYVFKKNEGIFRVTGVPGQFAATEHDRTVRVIGPETVQPLGNELMLLSDQGIAATSDSGTRILVTDEEVPTLRNWYWDQAAISNALRQYAYSMGHALALEELGTYELWLPNDSTPNAYTHFIYSKANDAWTDIGGIQACASAGGKVEDRRGFYALVGARKVYRQAVANYNDISSPISSSVDWTATGEDPLNYKQWTKVELLIGASPHAATQPATITFTFTTNLNSTGTAVAVSTGATDLQTVYVVPCPVPTEHQLGSWLHVSVASAESNKPLAILALAVHYEGGGDYAGR